MKILVTAASKHGSTHEIAEEIGKTLSARGSEVSVCPTPEVADVERFDAVVIGSAVYAGHWMKPAKELISRNASHLAAVPVWIFSSGPVGSPPKPEDAPLDVMEIVAAIAPIEHRVFAGKIDKSRLNLAERAVVKALKIEEGDYRDLEAVRAWGLEIAATLESAPVPF